MSFKLTSQSFKDGDYLADIHILSKEFGFGCAGGNQSPQLSWSGAPSGTKSFALLMLDPEGRPPGGVSHFVAYGIPATVTGFAEGELSKPSDKFVGGTSTMKQSTRGLIEPDLSRCGNGDRF